MLERFRPNEVAPHLDDIDLEKLQKKGVRGIICDIDNTLLPWDHDVPDKRAKQWIEKAKKLGIQVVLLSNALPRRARSLSEQLEIPARAQAVKPRRSGFKKALKEMDLEAREVAVVGDQLFTDIWGGNRMGMHTILVAPLAEKEFFSTRLLRCLEIKIKRKLGIIS